MSLLANIEKRHKLRAKLCESMAANPCEATPAELCSELVTFFEFLVALESPGAFFALLGAGGRN
jgi:hypothetical protein